MTMLHTPAPWSLGSNGATTKVVDADGKAICMVTYRKDHWNGDLLVAAPNLLAALRLAESALDAYSGGESADLAAIRAAIALATGDNA